jgi:ATP-dependent helicase HrpB
MSHYPIHSVLPQVKSSLSAKSITILQAPPGAGKSTVLPIELINEPWLNKKKIIMLEPRRLAAKSVANRMSQLLDQEVGNRVGYRVRFESKISKSTEIEVVTEGILTRMIQSDNALEEYSLVIFDEFHERSLNADLALALTLQVQQLLRPDLKILIMSATLDGEKLSQQLGNAPVITSQGKQYPIEHRHVTPDAHKPIVPQIASTVKKAFREVDGDILTFLPGAGEINRVFDMLSDENLDVEIFKLYGDLNFQQQQKALLPNPNGKRKIILSTSIAETSLTIEGIKAVVDCGLARVPRFDPRSGMTKLETIKVSKDSADQRAGRAGRLGPGVCYRMWPEFQTNQLPPTRKPEILEADLAPLLLELLTWGVTDINELKWIDTPPKGAVASALTLLEELDAVSNGKITSKGKQMAELPTHPRLAHMLLLAKEKGEVALHIACDVAALLEERDPASNEIGADLGLRVEMLQRFRNNERVGDKNALERIDRLAFSWRKWFGIQKSKQLTQLEIHNSTGLLIASAYPERIAKQQKRGGQLYKLSNGRQMKLDAQDALLHFEWLAVAQADLGINEGKIFLAAPLETQDLKDLERTIDVLRWDNDRELVVATKEVRVGGLVLKSNPTALPSQEKVNEVILNQIKSRGLKWGGWGEELEQLQARILSLKHWQSNEPWPDTTEENLLNSLEKWLSPFLINIHKKTDLLKLDWHNILKSILSWEQQNALDKLVPARIEVPSGSQIKIDYHADGRAPELPVRLQELFGLEDTPTVNDGKVRLMIHLLSPAYRPVQVTQDLKSFWNGAYHEVRKELRSRYPKHSWPEDPWTAEAVRGARKRS